MLGESETDPKKKNLLELLQTKTSRADLEKTLFLATKSRAKAKSKRNRRNNKRKNETVIFKRQQQVCYQAMR